MFLGFVHHGGTFGSYAGGMLFVLSDRASFAGAENGGFSYPSMVNDSH